MSPQNPYQAPQAPVSDYSPPVADSGRLAEPRRRDAGDALQWLGTGWRYFTAAPGVWIGITVVWFVFALVMNFVPLVGGLASAVLTPIFFAGMFLGLAAQHHGEPFGFGHLFKGFERNAGQLALVGLLYLAGIIVVAIVAVVPLLMVGGLGVFGSGGEELALGVVLYVLLVVALAMPVLMAYWFAPALVALDDLPAVEAMKLSFTACLRNMLPFLLYGLVWIPIMIIATLPLALGWLVAFPLFMGAWYVSYREIFFED